MRAISSLFIISLLFVISLGAPVYAGSVVKNTGECRMVKLIIPAYQKHLEEVKRSGAVVTIGFKGNDSFAKTLKQCDTTARDHAHSSGVNIVLANISYQKGKGAVLEVPSDAVFQISFLNTSAGIKKTLYGTIKADTQKVYLK